MEKLIGKIFYESWGYNMTLNDYCIVVSETDKSVMVQMIGMKVENDDGRGSGRSFPDINEKLGVPFRLLKRSWNGGGVYLKGSYPFSLRVGDTENGVNKRMGSFSEYKGQGNYYNTWD